MVATEISDSSKNQGMQKATTLWQIPIQLTGVHLKFRYWTLLDLVWDCSLWKVSGGTFSMHTLCLQILPFVSLLYQWYLTIFHQGLIRSTCKSHVSSLQLVLHSVQSTHLDTTMTDTWVHIFSYGHWNTLLNLPLVCTCLAVFCLWMPKYCPKDNLFDTQLLQMFQGQSNQSWAFPTYVHAHQWFHSPYCYKCETIPLYVCQT